MWVSRKTKEDLVLKRIAPVVMAALLMVVPTTATLAQENVPLETDAVKFSAVGGSGAAGWAWVTPYMDKLIVTVLLTGVEPNSAHGNHIHRGSCTSGPPVYPLTQLVANADGVATATTLVSADMAAMMNDSWFVMAHISPTGGSGIVCGDMKPMMMMEMTMPGM
jgi:hypothetical protein